jgi:hypothetical protein
MESGCHGRRGVPSQGEGGGGGGRPGGGRGGGPAKKGQKGKGPPLGFLCGRKETMAQMTLT